jgi:serine/threonine protein kinase
MSHQHPEQPRDADNRSPDNRADSRPTTIRPDTGPSGAHGESLVGRVLRSTYRILDVLEKGGMGTVYRGEHQRLKRPVAIKVLAQHLAADPAALTRFQREADIVSQLHHPHIVHILDYDTTDEGDPYIVMELLSGETLSRRLDHERILPLRDVVQIVAQTAGGLVVAHASGIVHRDLKPDNVFLLDMQDNSVFVKLLDFGISRRVAATRRVTGEYDVLGTPDYMAPEQVINTANADHRADQWSLAAMAYEMIGGRIPFFGETVAKTLAKVVGDAPRPLTELAPGIPKDVEAVVARGLAKEPSRRFSSIMEFADHLASAAGLSLGPRPMKSVAAHESVTANERPTLNAASTAPTEPPPVAHARPHRPSLTPSSESRLPVPTVPRSDPVPHSEVQSLSAHNPRLRHSDPPPSQPNRASRPPLQGRLRSPSPSDPALLDGSRQAPQFGEERTMPSARTPGTTQQTDTEALVRLRAAMDEVRQAVTFGEEQRALAKARAVLQLAQFERSRDAKEMVANATELLRPILLRSLGGLDRKVTLTQPPSSRGRPSMSPEHVFLLSRIDGTTTIEELLDVSPLSTAETLGILIDFREQGYLGFD